MSLLKQSIVVSGARLIDKLLSFVIVLWISRHFGNAGLGEFNYFFSLTCLFLPLLDMGLTMTYMQRWHERDTAGRRLLMSQMILLKLGFFGLALGGSLAGDFINHPSQANPWAVCAAMFALLFDDFADLLRRPAHAQGGVWLESLCPLLSRGAQIVLVYIYMDSLQSGYQVLYIFAAANALEVLASIAGLKGYPPSSLRGSQPGDYWRILQNGFPFAVTGLFVMTTLHLDSVLLQHFNGYENVGTYTAATRIIMVLNVLNGGICHALFPKILKAKADSDPGHAGWLVNGTLRGFIILFGGIALGGVAVGPGLMVALYGKDFTAAGPIFQVLSPMILLGAIYSLLGQVLEILGQQRKVLRVYAVSAFMNVAGNVLLIPKFGMYGAAAATLVSSLYVAIVLLRMIYENEHVKMYNNGVGRAFVFLIVLGLCYVPLMSMNAYFSVPLGALIFAAILLPLRKYWFANMGRLGR